MEELLAAPYLSKYSNYSNCMLIVLLMLPTLLVGISTLALLYYLRKNETSRKLRRPPGPRGLPIIGHLHLLGKLPHHSLFQLSKVHGPLMWLQLGSVPAVVQASSPEMARQILRTHDHAFAGRMQTVAVKHLFGGSTPDIAFAQPNAHWKFMRRLCMNELFSPKRLEYFKSMRDEEVRILMHSVLDESIDAGRKVDDSHQGAMRAVQSVRGKLMETTNNIITRMMLGKRLSELAIVEGGPALGDMNASNIVNLLPEFPKLLGMFNVGDYLPFLALMDLQGCARRSKRLNAALRATFEGLIRERCLSNSDELKQSARPKDYLDLLLQASTHTPFDIVSILEDMLIAGTDTSSITVEWALAELLLNPKKMRAVQAEMDEVVGKGRVIEEEDIGNLPYLTACVKETMRLHPVVPLLIPHMSNQECEISGFYIPENTVAYVNVWAMGRDPKVWECPTQFWPERFVEGACGISRKIGVQGQDWELLPFGSGRRMCPGWRLGLVNVQIILARLLQGFEWSLPHTTTTTSTSGQLHDHQLDMSNECFGVITSLAAPLLASTTPRLPRQLY